LSFPYEESGKSKRGGIQRVAGLRAVQECSRPTQVRSL